MRRKPFILYLQEKRFQSTHPSWGATRWKNYHMESIRISIHAPIVGCDYSAYTDSNKKAISIHAPIVGCDLRSFWTLLRSFYFNPRTHRGVRQRCLYQRLISCKFQSTHPSWGATASDIPSSTEADNFNPRTHRGVRPKKRSKYSWWSNFNPRTHRGVRPCRLISSVTYSIISIHAPIVGCDRANQNLHLNHLYFNPRTHRGVRLQK